MRKLLLASMVLGGLFMMSNHQAGAATVAAKHQEQMRPTVTQVDYYWHRHHWHHRHWEHGHWHYWD
jgi:hypothetical protein